MTKVDEGFRGLKTAPAPDLWREIEDRTPHAVPGPPVSRRIAVAALALAIAGTGTWLAARAFLDSPEEATRTTEQPPAPPTLRLGPSARFHGAGGGGPLYAFGSIWLPQHHVIGKAEVSAGKADVLLRIDPETLEIQAQIEIPSAPGWEIGNSGLAASEDAVWIVGGIGAEATVTKIDPATNEVVGGCSVGGEFAGDVAVTDTTLWVSVFGRGSEMSVAKIEDTGVPDVVTSIPVEGDWVREVFAVGDRVVVHTRGGGEVNQLHSIDPSPGEIVATNGIREGIFTDWNGSVWAGADDTMLRIDPKTLDVVERFPLDVYVAHTSMAGGAGGVWFMGHDPEDGADSATALMRFNPETGGVDSTIDVGGEPVALEVGGGAVWVLSYDGTLTRVDVET